MNSLLKLSRDIIYIIDRQEKCCTISFLTAKGKCLQDAVFFIGKTNEEAMRNPKRRQSTVSCILE